MTTTPDTPKNYAPLWKKAAVAGAVAATLTGLMVSQNLTQVKASHTSEYISVADFAAGDTHATIISTDGKAYSRGWNNTGQAGIQAGSQVNISDWTEVNVPEKLASVKASDHTVALTTSGALYTWGPNTHGQIGNGTNTTAFIPTQITAVDRFSKIASGNAFTVALDAEGRLWSWGANNAGQLGDGTTNDRSVPQLVGGNNTFKEVYAAKDTAYAIDSNGLLWAWGANNAGQIGDGTTETRRKPEVVETNKTWNRLAVNLENDTVLGIDSSGWLYSWGANTNGLLGNGTDWRFLQEEENARFKAMIAQIEAEDNRRRITLINQCVENAYKDAYATYRTEYEKVSKERDEAEAKLKEDEAKKNAPSASPSPTPSATASPSPSASPTSVPFPSPTASPSASAKPIPNPDDLDEPTREDFTDKCATDVDKTFAKTDTSGMKPAVIKEPALKEGHKRPEQVTGDYRVKDIALGSENGYVVDVLNRLHAWGKDTNGQTGLGIEDDKTLTQVPVFVREGVTDVDAGRKYGVAVASNGDLLMWGTNSDGVFMSNPSSEPKLSKPTVKGTAYTAVTAGSTTVYGFKNQTVYAWGNNANGEAGVGSADNSISSPLELDRKILAVAPSAKGAVALGNSNQLLSWGLNDHGQFGNNKTSGEAERRVTSNEINTFSSVSTGDNYTTAVASDGRVWGWGSNAGKLLDLSGNTKDSAYPIALSTGLGHVTAVASGKNVNAMTDGSVLNIWAGGVSHTYDLENIEELAAGDDHVVVRNKEGKVWNWSLNESGTREGTKPATLTKVDDRAYTGIAAGGKISGAVTESGETVLWGDAKLRLAEKEGDAVQNFNFTKLSINGGYILATDKNNVLWGWGQNRYLVLGSQSVHEFPTVLTSQEEKTNTAAKKEVK